MRSLLSRRAAIVAVLSSGVLGGCQAKDVDTSDGSGGKNENELVAPVEPARPEPGRAEPGRAEPESVEAKPVLRIELTRTGVWNEPYEFEAEPEPQGKALEGLTINDCATTVPCGWAKLCEELALRWLRQVGLDEAQSEVGARQYTEAKCGDEPPLPTSGDFVAHAAVIQHSLDIFPSDRVAGLLVRTAKGWKGLARIEEQLIEGMSSQRVQVPRASWQLELDEHPGKELVVLTTGYDLLTADDDPGYAWLIVCRALPEPSCRRVALRKVKQLEIFDDGRVVADDGTPKRFEQLDRADQLLK